MIDFNKYIKIKDESKTHAFYSPSGMDRILGCAGHIQLILEHHNPDGEPLNRDNVHSIRGTNAHTLLEFLLREGIDGIVALKTRSAQAFKDHIEYDEDMYMSVLRAFHFIRKERMRMTERVGREPTFLVERKVRLDKVVKADCSGTADVGMFHEFGVLHVMDYKNGKSIVEAEDNAQMMTYALGFLEEMGWDFDRVKLTIIQPNAATEHFTRTANVTLDQMEKFKHKLIKGIALTKQEDAPLVESSKYCYFCPVKKFCPLQEDKKRDKILDKFRKPNTVKGKIK